jgi:hypothetical protein
MSHQGGLNRLTYVHLYEAPPNPPQSSNDRGFLFPDPAAGFPGLWFNRAIIKNRFVVFQVDANLPAFLHATKQNFIR